jgi:GNAT superfamily N-acetyltransferase
MVEIRNATPIDIPLVLDFIRGLAEYEKLAHLVSATAETLQDSLFGSQPGAEVVLAFDGDTAVGFAVFFHNFSTFLGKRGLWLEDIFVKPTYRTRGYGRALFLHVARIAHERGCGRFEWAALDWNTPAIEFYKAHGAVALDDWTIFRASGDTLARLARST